MKRTKDNVIAGVCGGIAKELGVDPVLVRLAFLLSFLFFGVGPLIYLVLWVIMGKEE